MESVPSVLLYSQALVILKQLEDALKAGLFKTTDEIAEAINNAMNQFENNAGVPLVLFDPVVETEPPSSLKMNAFWRATKHDISILQQQLDLLRASGTFTFNYLTTETAKARQLNASLENKVKVLQLYSDSADPNMVTFGDAFASRDFVDDAFVSPELRANIVQGMFLSLGRKGALVNLSNKASVEVLDSSNGFLGNNQELVDPASSPTNPVTGEKIYTFKAETKRSAEIKTILDDKPSTWVEYEHVWVSQQDRAKADNLNFVYLDNSVVGETKYVNWAKGPSNQKLKFDFQIDLKVVQKMNYITLNPFGLDNNENFPFLVKLIETSEDGSDWTRVAPSNVWIGNKANINNARAASDVAIGSVSWAFEERFARYVRVHVEQPHSIPVPIGHLYYINRKDTSQNPKRVEGPIPTVDNPAQYYGPNSFVRGDLLQKRELFNGKRWAIGLRDLSIQQVNYQEESHLVTQPLRVGGLVDRVALEADVYIPPGFDSNSSWVEFFVSPDNGLTWFQISRIQDDFLGLPEIIAFNDPIPVEFRDPSIRYVQVANPVDTLRLKIALKRPSNDPTSTPLVRSYKLKVRRK